MIWGGWFWSRFPTPLIAVDVFMFVSGYLMTHQWTRQHGSDERLPAGSVGEFLVRRFFRIAPLYYVVLAVIFIFSERLRSFSTSLFAIAGGGLGEAFDPAFRDFGVGDLLLRLSFLFGFAPQLLTSTFVGDWSLALEMQFYLAFPFLLTALRKRGAVALLVFGVAASFVTTESLRRLPPLLGIEIPAFVFPTLLPWKLTVFLAGMVAVEANRRFRQAPGQAGFLAALAVFMGALNAWQVAAVACLSFFLVAGRDGGAAGVGGRAAGYLERLLSNRVMAFLADTSYAVYLVHSLVICVAGGWLLNLPWVRANPAPVRVGVLFVLVAGLSYPVAWVLHHVIEKPGIGLGRKVAARWFPRKKAAPVRTDG
jgi:peptidoglycan/LPS O-acetylase OafA/YrhL